MYLPSDKRYDKMIYSRCGRSGLKLPKVSMGLWQNFGHQGRFSDMRCGTDHMAIEMVLANT